MTDTVGGIAPAPPIWSKLWPIQPVFAKPYLLTEPVAQSNCAMAWSVRFGSTGGSPTPSSTATLPCPYIARSWVMFGWKAYVVAEAAGVR